LSSGTPVLLRRIDPGRLLEFLSAMRYSGRRCGVIGHRELPQFGMPHAWKMLPADEEQVWSIWKGNVRVYR
jgi:hypothetical protein